MKLRILLIHSGGVALLAAAQFAIAQNSCEALKDLKLDHGEVVSAKWVEAGTIQVKLGFPPKAQSLTVKRHCEISAVTRPTSDSEINFILWLPPQEDWNGKYLQYGSGGWGGAFQFNEMVGPLAQGYAVAETDDGHKLADMTGALSPTWATGHPEKLIDFGYRAVHETATHSKVVVQDYFDKPASKAYFKGCSDGGREGLMEAERYPEDFDGVIAGAPANHWTHHFTGFVWNEFALYEKPESRIAPEQLPAIQKAALAACDELDGVKDGLIEDPRKCHFDPAVLLCHGAAGPNCLTQPQIDALKHVYAGPKDPKTGEQIYPGYETGTEAEPGAWLGWIVPFPQLPGSIQSLMGNGLFSQVVYENPKWDWHTMDFDRDLKAADEKVAPILNSYNPDLRTFRDHGGKLIQFHGWGDPAIAPRDSINFYEKVTAFLTSSPDPRVANATDVQAFYRLFMVPGMGHCTGGPGPTSFGNDATKTDTTPLDADHDLLMALDRWVTRGVAPDKLIGTGTIGADPKGGSGGVQLTRPLCPYPKTSHYKGQGDTNLADNFECVQDGTEKNQVTEEK